MTDQIKLNQMDRAEITTLYNDVTGRETRELKDSIAKMHQRVLKAVQVKVPEATMSEGVITLPGYADFDDARCTLTVWDITDPEEVEQQEQEQEQEEVTHTVVTDDGEGNKTVTHVKGKGKSRRVVTEHSPAKGRNLGVCATIRELLLEGKLDTQGIVEQVHKEIPQSRCTAKDVSIIRSKLRKEGKID